MKLIKKFKSSNFDKRNGSKISFIIIHYTALKNYKEAITYLMNPFNKVSSHFLISQTGEIYNLVNIKNRAWHAGISYWNGCKDLNSLSIGIELDYSNNISNNKYSKKMINSLIKLIKSLIKKYNIDPSNVLGHSDIAPFRKSDPGRNFPWKKLYETKIAFDPNYNYINNEFFKRWFYKNKLKTTKKISQFILGYIGYDVVGSKKNKKLEKKIIIAYQSHYIQKNITGIIDEVTFKFLIKHFSNKLLTKYQKNLKHIKMVR